MSDLNVRRLSEMFRFHCIILQGNIRCGLKPATNRLGACVFSSENLAARIDVDVYWMPW